MVFLQVWGGAFYLLNKIFLSFAERSEGDTKKKWRVWSWVVYLIGLPAVVLMLALKHNWIFSALEVGGAPAMVLGLLIALRDRGSEPKWLNRFAFVTIVVGLGYSVYDFGGMTTLGQWLEVGAVVGFLIGTYRLAKEHADGYLWYILMSASAGLLFVFEDLRWFALQQLASLLFIVDAYFTWRRKRNPTTEIP
ncbi:MAG: hypothetical protein ACREGC_01910 [Minisyncoccia bacterium]